MNTTTMKAVIYTEYGSPDVLRLQEVAVPTPADDEVLIKVQAATVTTGDVNIRGFTFVPDDMKLLPRLVFGLRKPKKPILGTEVAGDIVAVGTNVTHFKVGDRVFGIGSMQLGAHAEYVTRSADGALAIIPTGMSYAEAASVPFGALTALSFLKDQVTGAAGQQVLINGASGGVGVYAVQIAKALGAEVTGVCSARNADLVRDLGADYIIDYTHEDFTQNHAVYDLIVDTVMGKMSFGQAQPALKPNGKYLAVAGGFGDILRSIWNKRLVTGSPKEDSAGMLTLTDLLEAGQIKPVIDRTYSLEDTAAAHRYVETRRKRGSVVLTIA